jgi:hypothetical protein
MDRENIALTVGGVLATMALAYMFYRRQQSDAAQASSAAQADAIAAQDSSPAADPYNTNLTEEWLASSLTAASGAAITGLSSNTAAGVATSSAVSDLGASYDATDTAHMLSDIVAAYSGAPTSSFGSFNLGAADPAEMFNVGSAGSLNLDSTQLATVTLPAIAGVTQTATGNIPVSASDAITQAELALSPNRSNAIYAPPESAPGLTAPQGSSEWWSQLTDLSKWIGSQPGYQAPQPVSGWQFNQGAGAGSFIDSMESSPLSSSHPVTAHPITSIGV